MTLVAELTVLKVGIIALAFAALAGFVLLHLMWYIKPTPVESLAELQTRLSSGRPTIVEFYSNL